MYPSLASVEQQLIRRTAAAVYWVGRHEVDCLQAVILLRAVEKVTTIPVSPDNTIAAPCIHNKPTTAPPPPFGQWSNTLNMSPPPPPPPRQDRESTTTTKDGGQ